MDYPVAVVGQTKELMDKMILVFNVGFDKEATIGEKHKILNQVGVHMGEYLKDEKDILYFILPTNDHEEIKVECLNPKLMEPGEYMSIKERLDKISKDVEEFINPQ